MNRMYWAYGSNLSEEQMRIRCPRARKVGPLVLDGGFLVFRGVADVILSKGGKVAGGVWEVTPECEEQLDLSEGVSSGLYAKLPLRLEVDGKVRDTFFYKMQMRGIMPPAEPYFEKIEQGYKDFGLDPKLLEASLRHSWLRRYRTSGLSERNRRKGRPKWTLPKGFDVYDVNDPRHVGELTSRANGIGTVQWGNGWESKIPTRRLRVSEREREAVAA